MASALSPAIADFGEERYRGDGADRYRGGERRPDVERERRSRDDAQRRVQEVGRRVEEESEEVHERQPADDDEHRDALDTIQSLGIPQLEAPGRPPGFHRLRHTYQYLLCAGEISEARAA